MLLHNGRPCPLNVEQFGLHDVKLVEAGTIRETSSARPYRSVLTEVRLRTTGVTQ
jgi:hypothetical protein